MVQDLAWLPFPSEIIKYVEKGLLLFEPVFKTLTIYDMVWGYQDVVLHMAKTVYGSYFDTDIVGAMAGVSVLPLFEKLSNFMFTQFLFIFTIIVLIILSFIFYLILMLT